MTEKSPRPRKVLGLSPTKDHNAKVKNTWISTPVTLPPSQLRTVNFEGKLLIIAPLSLTWIVLDNDDQPRFFTSLQSRTVADAITVARVSDADARHVLTQIEARGLRERPSGDVDVSENVEHMQFFLTDGCNLRSPHCLMKATVKAPDELSTGEVRSVLAAFKGNGGRDVTFSGGEIALRPDLAEIIDYCNSIGLSAEPLTNGTLWTESLVSKVAGKVRRVQVSIDGFSEAANARIRGGGVSSTSYAQRGASSLISCSRRGMSMIASRWRISASSRNWAGGS